MKTDEPRVFYGENSNTCSKARGKKTNFICSDYSCGYSARNWVLGSTFEKSANSSMHCPIHKTDLVNVGNGSKLPKVGSKKRKNLIISLKP
jgi:hypothetical protein